MKIKMQKRQSGQALVVILLVMAVGLTMGLSVVSRSVADIRISQQEEESARAFSVAETGIEQALIGGDISGDIGGIRYNVASTSQGGDKLFDFGGDKIASGKTQTVWLIEHNEEGELAGESLPPTETITVCWGDDQGDKTAVEVSLIYQDATGEYQVVRGAYDADFTRGNGFDSADDIDGGNCGSLAFGETIDLTADFSIPGDATLYALRLKLLYNSQPEPLAVQTTNTSLPSQGTCYESTATVTESGVSRKVRQCQFFKNPPAILDYVLFSEGSIVK